MAAPSHASMDQSALIERAKQGDLRAFEQLLAEHVPRIRRFARSMCRDATDADDLAQDALLKAYLALGGYRFTSSFSTWLYRVVRNAFIDHARQEASRRRVAIEAAEPAHERETPETSPPDELLAKGELRAALWDALRALPLEYRTAVVLFDVEGLSHEEVAAVEGVALGTIKSRLSRGRVQLRALLALRGVEHGNAPEPALVQSRRPAS
jgi:RNA polymerase sigma-70 factor (ECF subfamily)